VDALDLLSGDARAFVEKVWATRTHVHRSSPADAEALLSLDDVDHLLTSTALRTPALRIARDGVVLPTSSYTRSATLAGAALTGLVDARKVFDLIDDGATVVLQGLHRYWSPLGDLVRDLELTLGHPCQANAYLTPPGSQGFALHSDTHDVFVVQTHGSKRWQIHDTERQHDVLLEPGTSMYLPTGTPHAARTQQSASLHVTIGVNQLTWRHVLDRVAGRLLADEQLDQALPADYLTSPGALADGLAERLSWLAGAVAAVDPVASAQEQVHHFLGTRPPALRGGLRDRLTAASIDDDTELCRRPGSVCVLATGGGRLRILLGDRELHVPSRLGPVMAHLREQADMRAADLAEWLDPQSRLVLVRRLVREGLLRVRA